MPLETNAESKVHRLLFLQQWAIIALIQPHVSYLNISKIQSYHTSHCSTPQPTSSHGLSPLNNLSNFWSISTDPQLWNGPHLQKVLEDGTWHSHSTVAWIAPRRLLIMFLIADFEPKRRLIMMIEHPFTKYSCETDAEFIPVRLWCSKNFFNERGGWFVLEITVC